MLTVTVKITADCEELLTNMPRGYEIGLVSEEYEDGGSGVVEFEVEVDGDLPYAFELALDSHPGVISYSVA